MHLRGGRLVAVVALVVLLGSPMVAGATAVTADFSYSPPTPHPDDSITLSADGSTASGTISSYEWDTNGDGQYGDYYDANDGRTVSVEYDTGGTYTVGLRVTTEQGETDTTRKQITVENPAPTATFTTSPSTPNPDETVSLDASGSSDSDGEIVSYEWDTNGDGQYGDYYDVTD